MSTEVTRAAPSNGVSLTEKIKYAEHLAQSGLLPKSYQQQPANVLLAMEYGDALGIHQMTAINEINVISGKPAMSASLMQSLARAAGHKVRVSGDAERAVCTIIRKDDPDYEHRAEWTKAKAEASGLWGRGHWAKDPALMLKWRAISECVRLACSEVLGGLKYIPEEVTEFTSPEWRPQPAKNHSHQAAPAAPQATPSAPGAASPGEGPAEDDSDQIDLRIEQIWDDANQIATFGKWMRGARPQDPRLQKLQARYTELTRPAHNEPVEAEIVDEENPHE